MLSLGDALPKEIKRCQKLVEIYKTIPNGQFGAAMIQHDIDDAEAAQAVGDAAMMLVCYHKLKLAK